MLRLDESLRADALLTQGTLTQSRIDVIASALATFHAGCAKEPWIARFGAPALVEQHVAENFTTLRQAGANVDESVEPIMTEEALGQLERWQIAFVRGRQDLFNQRAARGFVREGHGDLRLEHIFFRARPSAGGRPPPTSREEQSIEIIDGIEFNDRYRFGDVASDIAFLAMDLGRLGRVDLAERLLAVYARESNDYDLYHLVDFYESYRACVRAKISAAANAVAEARRYLLLAQSSRQRSVLSPVFIAIAGGIAAGKSALAERLAEELSAPIVDADRTRKFLVGAKSATEHRPEEPWQGIYDPRVTSHVYGEVLRRAGAVLASGRPVIVDASFRSVESRALARELAGQHNVPFRLIECVAPYEVRRDRLILRANARHAVLGSTPIVSDAGPEILESFDASYEPIVEICPTEHFKVNTAGATEIAVESAKSIIGTWPAGLVQ